MKTKGTHKTNYNIVEAITLHYPALTLWVDAGISNIYELNTWEKLGVRLVLGSENFTNIDSYCSLQHHKKDFILSLDFMPHGYQGPEELCMHNKYWPQDVIIMSLANVGSNQGANMTLLNEVLSHNKNFNVYAAGGIRDLDDLRLLKEKGVHGALIATALHQKKISTKALEDIAQ